MAANTSANTPLQRKLVALDYHSPAVINLEDKGDVKALVVWLEDQKIRSYKIEERESLRNDTGDQWWSTFKKYIKYLECPYDPDQSLSLCIHWLLDTAVRYEFNEMAERDSELRRQFKPPSKEGPLSPLDINPKDPIFERGVTALAHILQITKHPDPVVLLAACRLVIEEKLNKEALNKRTSEREDSRKPTKYHEVTAKQCGFDLGDPVLSEAAKVLRLLHIKELRDLQTKINELIVSVQNITANPKTDSSLGAVGR